jgi:hypothetical protein
MIGSSEQFIWTNLIISWTETAGPKNARASGSPESTIS